VAEFSFRFLSVTQCHFIYKTYRIDGWSFIKVFNFRQRKQRGEKVNFEQTFSSLGNLAKPIVKKKLNRKEKSLEIITLTQGFKHLVVNEAGREEKTNFLIFGSIPIIFL
jgi:hypothetical protein